MLVGVALVEVAWVAFVLFLIARFVVSLLPLHF